MLIFCNYLEAHIMMYDIKLIRVFLSCYKRILLSHQIIVSSRTQTTLLFFPTNISSPQKRRTTQRSEIKEIIVGVEEKKKTQGMRRNLAHFCGVLNTPSSSYQLNDSTRFGCFLCSYGRKLDDRNARKLGGW